MVPERRKDRKGGNAAEKVPLFLLVLASRREEGKEGKRENVTAVLTTLWREE